MRLAARLRKIALVASVGGFALPASAGAQAPIAGVGTSTDVFVGSHRERYLRVLQTLGLVRPYPWSIRGFSPHEIERLHPLSDAHPWAAPVDSSNVRRASGPRQELIPATFSARYNTAFPFGLNDGATWAGRGLTVAAQAGGSVRHGPVSVVVAPLIFLAENRSFALMSNGQTGRLQFADPLYPTAVDRPQRFGTGGYWQLDLGQSTARVDFAGIAFGASTANQWWGPMMEFPFLMGNNAPGFTHVFLGSATPRNVWVGRLHLRVIYGGLAQTSYTDITDSTQHRLASGLVVVFSPRGTPGLELGVARFFHIVRPEGGIGSAQLRKPFEGIFKATLPQQGPSNTENQLASLFARWVLPQSGVEIYAEYGREDHNLDTRDLIQEPDHTSTYGIGIQKAWIVGTANVLVARGELINFEIPQLVRDRVDGGFYLNTALRQGHTHRGQLLGTGFAVGSGAGSSLHLERYTRTGSESISWSRLVRQEGGSIEGSAVRCSTACLDVQHVLRVDRLRRRGRFDVRYGLSVVYELNRDFRRDAMNLSPELEIRWRP